VQQSLRGGAGPAPARAEPLRAAPRPAAPPVVDEKKKIVSPAAPAVRPAAAEAALPQGQSRPDASDDPLVQKTVRLFDGRIIRKGE
jgi:hypothetical protein